MRVGREVERWESPNCKHLVRIFTRGPGAFYFVELSELTEHGETFWATTRTSGDHGSLDFARNAACIQLPWFREVT